jgi:beta-glucosidase-like glycosyl hydrolase
MDILAGAHVIYSYSSTEPPSELTSLASQGLIGGVILFGENIDSDTPGYMEDLQKAFAASPAPAVLEAQAGASGPLIIMTDQEGGQVVRLPGGPTQSAKEVGESSDPGSAGTSAGNTAAAALDAYNVNNNLAPVMGVYRSSGDFLDQYQRSYGDTAAMVEAAATPFLEAMQANGIIATAKHFPGLGAATASEDTDSEPVTINLTLDDIRDIDEVPFQSAVDAGVDMVMASWAVYPCLDARPSGLSNKWIQDELRGRLGFTGVTITDSMDAGAITQYGSLGTRGTLATGAGMDILMATGGDPANGESIRTALVSGVNGGSLSSSDFSASTKRIMAMRAKLA